MRSFNHLLFVVLLLTISSLFLVNSTTAQKRSYENKKISKELL